MYDDFPLPKLLCNKIHKAANLQSIAFACISGRIPRLETIPTTHREAVRKDGAEIPRGWSLPECFTSSGDPQRPPLF